MDEAPLPPPLSLSVGAVLGGKYRLERELGRGGMGVVFRATHLRLGKPVAIKMLLPEALSSPGAVERFDREARAAAQIKSQHVAEVLDIDLHLGLPYMVMEFLEGHDLSMELAQRGPLPVAEVVDWLLQVCSAMAEAHARGIVHRDLKPSNLFLATQEGRRTIKILDFGISKIMSPHEAHLTATTEGFGTVLYMSPEQVRSTKQTDARGDVWSLGVIAYELLTNQLPFLGESATAIVASILTDPFTPLDTRRSDLPPGLVDVIHRTLVKDRNKRTQTMADFAADLAPFGSGRVASPSLEPITDRDLDDAATLRKTPKLNRRSAGALGLALLGAVVLAGVGLKVRGENHAETGVAPGVTATASASAPQSPASASASTSPSFEIVIDPPDASAQPKTTAGPRGRPPKTGVAAPPSTKPTKRLD